MRKNFITYVVACLCAVLTAQADNGFGSDITDWAYVENGTIYTTVSIENAGGVVITSPDYDSPVELKDGLNTIKVPLSQPVYKVSAKDGYTITIKVGENTYVYDKEPIAIDCAKPAPVYIYAFSTTSNGLTVTERNVEVKYFDLNGMIVNNPEVGKIYIKVCGAEAHKVKF